LLFAQLNFSIVKSLTNGVVHVRHDWRIASEDQCDPDTLLNTTYYGYSVSCF